MSDSEPIRVEDEFRKQLDQANADFEEFVSRAAHNLRESLREIASYSQLMSEIYASRLDSDAAVYLARIQEGAARTQSLLADVVDYWAMAAAAGNPLQRIWKRLLFRRSSARISK